MSRIAGLIQGRRNPHRLPQAWRPLQRSGEQQAHSRPRGPQDARAHLPELNAPAWGILDPYGGQRAAHPEGDQEAGGGGAVASGCRCRCVRPVLGLRDTRPWPKTESLDALCAIRWAPPGPLKHDLGAGCGTLDQGQLTGTSWVTRRVDAGCQGVPASGRVSLDLFLYGNA